MRGRAMPVAVGALVALLGAGGCRPNPSPDRLFADAERLRSKYEKHASEQAIAFYRDAATAWAERHDSRNAALANHRLGLTYQQLGLLNESVRAHLAALTQAQACGDRLLESEVRSDLGTTASLAAHRDALFDDARKHCEVALELAREMRDVRQQANALACLGEVAYNRGDRGAALRSYRDAEVLWKQAGEPRGEAESVGFQGSVHVDHSELDAADACYRRAMILWQTLGDTRGIAITRVGRARLLNRRGAFEEALEEFQEAQALLEPMGDAVWEGASLTGLGDVYLNMGDTTRAFKHWTRALGHFEAAGLRSFSADLLLSIGEAHLANGDLVDALEQFDRALALARELGNDYWQAYALRFIGLTHLIQGAPTMAEDYLARSLQLQRHLDDPRFEAQTHADLGETRRRLGQFPAARSSLHQGLALTRAIGDRVGEARCLFGLSQLSADLKDLASARRWIDEALSIVESVRTEVESRDLRASYFASVQRYHQLRVDVLMRLHESQPRKRLAAAAFAASERGRARSLLDTLAEAGIDLRVDLDRDLLEREAKATRAFEDWAQRHRLASSGPRAGSERQVLAEEYRDLEVRYEQVQAEIRRRSPRYAALARPQPLALREVQAWVLDEDTLLLEYSLGDERSYLWAVGRRGYATHVLPPRADIEGAAHRVYQLATARLTISHDPGARASSAQADQEYWEEAARLSGVLLGPVSHVMRGKRLLVVADGVLQYLPFAALPVPGNVNGHVPLLVEHEIVSLPSASALGVLRRETARRAPSPRMLAVLADPVFEPDDPRLRGRADRRSRGHDTARIDEGPLPPRLATTRLEADAITAAARGGPVARRLDFEASRATATSGELSQYRIVHFATHGVVDSANPGLSGIVLSLFDEEGRPQAGFLRLRDIYALQLPAELVVLSACNTALGKDVRGEGLVGLVRGFMYAGAKRVVASLWKVDDDATGELMGRFYAEMLQHHRSPAAALRQAQLALWQQDRWRPPFYWAAFVIQGEWR